MKITIMCVNLIYPNHFFELSTWQWGPVVSLPSIYLKYVDQCGHIEQRPLCQKFKEVIYSFAREIYATILAHFLHQFGDPKIGQFSLKIQNIWYDLSCKWWKLIPISNIIATTSIGLILSQAQHVAFDVRKKTSCPNWARGTMQEI